MSYLSAALQITKIGLFPVLVAVSVHADARTATTVSAPLSVARDECKAAGLAPSWWVGFNDATLNMLQLMADRRSDVDGGPRDAAEPYACRDLQVTASYVQLRIISARLALLRAMHGTVARQIAIVEANQAETRDDVTQLLRTRMVQVTARMDTSQSLAKIHVDALQSLTGVEERQLLSAIAPALQEYAVPRYRADIPASLPDTKPATRGVVQASAGRRENVDRWPGDQAVRTTPATGRGVDAMMTPLSTADSNGVPGRGDALMPGVASSEAADDDGRVQHRLRTLHLAGSAAVMLGQLVSTRRVELETTRQRHQLGHATELEVSERHFMMLLDTERLNAALGDVALAWIALHQAYVGGLHLIAEPGEVLRRELLPN